MTWREEDHPRDGRGRFTDDWAGTVATRLTNSGYVRGRDLGDELDYDAIFDLQDQISGDEGMDAYRRNGDLLLGAIWKAQGFDGPPQVLDREQFDQATQGRHVYYRGIRDFQDRDGNLIATGRDLAEQYHTGQVYPSSGYWGNGTYATTRKDEAELYTKPDDRFGWGEESDTPHAGALLRMALIPEARIVDFNDLEARGRAHEDVLPGDTKIFVLQDVGRMASVLGYDAIRLPRDDDVEVVVILNRTAVIVETAP